MWICQQCGFVNNVDLSTVCICQQRGYVNSVDLSTVWICQQCGFVNNVDLSTAWICQQCGFVNSVHYENETSFVDERNLARNYLLKLTLLKKLLLMLFHAAGF